MIIVVTKNYAIYYINLWTGVIKVNNKNYMQLKSCPRTNVLTKTASGKKSNCAICTAACLSLDTRDVTKSTKPKSCYTKWTTKHKKKKKIKNPFPIFRKTIGSNIFFLTLIVDNFGFFFFFFLSSEV